LKRIVTLIDGTWDSASAGGTPTNVARLDPGGPRAGAHLIAERDAAEVAQIVLYHSGVGAMDKGVRYWLSGIFGLGLRAVIEDAYIRLCAAYAEGDALFFVGFSRGAYAARALAGLVAASGVIARADAAEARVAWNHYRVAPAARSAPLGGSAEDQAAVAAHRRLVATGRVRVSPPIEAVAVFDTVGSYGIPAGYGLAGLARWWAWWRLGFHDTELGATVRVGLHAIAVDEHRRAFSPTFWTRRKAAPAPAPSRVVEQTWFAGSHCDVGGGNPDARLANLALIWMAARLQTLSGLAFDDAAMAALGTGASPAGGVVDSTIGWWWWLDHRWPRLRAMLSPDAFDPGFFRDDDDPSRENVDERVHWSVLEKTADPAYAPLNLPANLSPDRVAAMTAEEARWLGRRIVP
jgi:uncharacterized protein (DUF2235 family)